MHLNKLSATDRAFLDIEGDALQMHIGAVIILEGGALRRPDGGVDLARLCATLAEGLSRLPRFAQRVREVPGLGAVWVDDATFRLERHVLHTAVPRPGDDVALRRLAGRVLAHPLDRSRPLWELWVVEGLEDGRFALILKVHHAMVDGVAGVEVLAALLRVEPDDRIAEVTAAPPAPEPSRLAMAAGLVSDGGRAIADTLRGARAALEHPLDALRSARDLADGVYDTLKTGLRPAMPTSINPAALSHHRAFGGLRVPLGTARACARALGGTVNDVVLTAVAGALRTFLARAGDDVDALTDFRALVPVNLRGRDVSHAGSTLGNHISLVLMPIPVAVGDARARFEAVRRASQHMKSASHEIEGAALVERIGDVGGPNVVTAVFRTAARLRAFNVVVTNVPGPQFPLYLGTCRMHSIHGSVPLFAHQGVGITALSYDGGVFFGVHADAEVMPEVEPFLDDLRAAMRGLALAAGCADPPDDPTPGL